MRGPLVSRTHWLTSVPHTTSPLRCALGAPGLGPDTAPRATQQHPGLFHKQVVLMNSESLFDINIYLFLFLYAYYPASLLDKRLQENEFLSSKEPCSRGQSWPEIWEIGQNWERTYHDFK